MMAKPDLERNTDVPSTIAGFYYQIVIACREICQDGIKEVGVETGADVVTIDALDRKYYTEAKLHSCKFSRFSSDITKTIYNFYNSYKTSDQIEEMNFTTNAGKGVEDSSFFDTWGTAGDDEVRYIQEAVLRKSIELHGECKKNYSIFCAKISSKNEKNKKSNAEAVKKLCEEVFVKKSLGYSYYAVENPDCSYQTFIQKLKFKFYNKEKDVLLAEIEEEAEKKIADDYMALPENINRETLPEEGVKHIFCSLVKMFFDRVAKNSQHGVCKNISVQDYRDCLKDYLAYKVVSEEARRVKESLERLSYDESEIIDSLDLDKDEDRAYLACYSRVKQIFLMKLNTEKGSYAFMAKYLLKKSMYKQKNEIDSTILELLNMLTVILYEEGIKIEDVKLFFEDKLDNLEIIGRLRCCYKRAYRKTRITDVVREIVKNYDVQWGSSDKQVIVAEANYYTGARPCDIRELQKEVFDITQVDENFRDYEFFKSFNYKCSNCLERNGKEYQRFWNGGGGLCKKI